jgi:hypothetical protein
MRLAFVADDLRHHVGALITQETDGSLSARLSGDPDPAAAEAQPVLFLSP